MCSRDPCDRVELTGAGGQGPSERGASGGDAPGGSSGKPFLRLWFACAGQYARAHRVADGSAYAGTCPKCGASVRFPIGPGGTSERFFQVSCR